MMGDYKKIRKIIREIVSTEVERFSGGASEIQKNQNGFGYLGSQKDTPKQNQTNDKHFYFHTIISSDNSEGENEDSSTEVSDVTSNDTSSTETQDSEENIEESK